MSFLEQIKSPADLKKLNIKELGVLAEEIRSKIVTVVKNNGGHLSSNLGSVEFIIALIYVFDFPNDKIIFDVGHQSYTYKILCGRNDLFDTIRQEGGLSGFPNIFESNYDFYTSGHAGSAISAGLGYCQGRDLSGQDYNVISVVGDGALFNGLTMEALTCDEKKPEKFLVILNDNGMSISENNSGLYKNISKLTTKKRYSKAMTALDKSIGKSFIGKWLKRFKTFIKRTLNSLSVVDMVGLNYVGVFDGHNLKQLIKLFTNFKNNPRPTLLHLKTKKGKGMDVAEEHSSEYHGVGKNLVAGKSSFSASLGKILSDIATKDEKVVAITAAMKDGTGLNEFENVYKSRFFDVGINEEHAVVLASGMALSGLKPIVCIYSTFLQRAYDEIMIDVCLQKLPVIFCIDRAGFTGEDGQTHQGLYDLSYLRSIPNLTVLCPKNVAELEDMLNYALTLNSPVAIRYCNGKIEDIEGTTKISNDNLWEVLKSGNKDYVLANGNRMINLAYKLQNICNTDFTIVNARSVKPLDEKFLQKINSSTVITLEENNVIGGFGSAISEYFANKSDVVVRSFGANDVFVEHKPVQSQMRDCGLTAENIKKELNLI